MRATIAGMASIAQWVEGARPRTLPNAVAPVIAGTGAAAWLDALVWWKALLALAVSLALIIGVNFANDYSDGIRGTDDERAGPLRLVGSKLATPRAVLAAAIVSLGVGAVAGLALAIVSAPWLIAVGVVCIAGAWLYTGGSRPYGYAGFGEVAVFVFFGLVAVLGTQYTQALRVDWVGLTLAVATGALSSAVLVANNLRDIPTDRVAGKLTLAVRLGDGRTRVFYQSLLGLAGVLTLVLMLATPWCAVGLVAAPLALRAAGPVRHGLGGRELIPVLRDTGLTMLVWSVRRAGAGAWWLRRLGDSRVASLLPSAPQPGLQLLAVAAATLVDQRDARGGALAQRGQDPDPQRQGDHDREQQRHDERELADPDQLRDVVDRRGQGDHQRDPRERVDDDVAREAAGRARGLVVRIVRHGAEPTDARIFGQRRFTCCTCS